MIDLDVFYEQVEQAYELRDMLYHSPERGNPIGVLEYFDFFCEHMDCHPGALVTSSRKQEYVKLRFQFIAFVREQSNKTITYREIGQLLGGRDHSSMIHGEDQHREWMLISSTYKQDYQSLNKIWELHHERAND